MAASDFVSNLHKELIEKKDVVASTADSYIRTLIVLNDKVPFKNLSFLKKKDVVMAKLAEYAPSTQKSVLAMIVSVLSLFQSKPTYKSTFTFYHNKMVDAMREARESETSEKTDKQKTNWIDWKDIKKMSDDAYAKVKELSTKKVLTSKEAEHLLNTMVLSLYTCVPPRRNQDYLDMLVVKKWDEKMDKSHNYLDLAGSQFVFNKYKTAKKYGTQIVKIPNDEENPLMDTLAAYLKHNPFYKAMKGKNPAPIPFLVSSDGTPFVAANSITRILNKIFGKKVGSSMLRHVYLSDKYGKQLEEQKEDSAAMGHDLDMQRSYIRTE
jgi:hypothetical protein